MHDKPTADAKLPSPGYVRKSSYDERMQFTKLEDGTLVQTHWRMDVYVSAEDRIQLAEILKKLKPKGKGSTKHLGRKILMSHLLDRYELPDPKAVFPTLPDAGDRLWRALASDLIVLLGSNRQVDMTLLSQLAWRISDFVDTVDAR
jgi:hypothetical protein